MKKHLILSFLLLFLCALLAPLPVQAQEPVDPARDCSLELEYAREGAGFPDLEIRIYRVADLSADGSYGLIPPFDRFPVTIHGFTSQQEWKDAANTLSAYITADQLSPTAAATTDDAGRVLFSGLETGVYLVMGCTALAPDGTCLFENFFVFLPTPQSDGTQNYNVFARPKHSFTPAPPAPETIDYQVLKLWRDSGASDSRPRSVTVDILRNGQLWETVVLSPENNWTHTWTAEDNGDLWTVVERDVAEDYTVVITQTDTCFVLTNTLTGPGDTPPDTGDDFSLRFWACALVLSGLMLVLLGIWNKRNGK